MARRGPGEGSVYRRGNGRWVACLHLGYAKGERRRRYFYGKTRKEVASKLAGAQRDEASGAVEPRRTRVGPYLLDWLDATRPLVRPRTYQSYEAIVRLHLTPELGRVRLSELTPVDVQLFLRKRLLAGRAPRTVQHMHAVLHRALQQGVRWGFLQRNVAALVDAPRVPQSEIRPLSPEQAKSLLRAVEGHSDGAIYSVALGLGLRLGEILALRWCDLDLLGGVLSVSHTLQRIGGEFVLAEPKTPRSRRSLVMPQFVVVALTEHRARLPAERTSEGEFVFLSESGRPRDAASVTKRLQRTLSALGLPRQRFHDLRHACASLLLSEGVHPRVVMETLGHSQFSLTMNTYGHLFPSSQREAAASMDRALTGAIVASS